MKKQGMKRFYKHVGAMALAVALLVTQSGAAFASETADVIPDDENVMDVASEDYDADEAFEEETTGSEPAEPGFTEDAASDEVEDAGSVDTPSVNGASENAISLSGGMIRVSVNSVSSALIFGEGETERPSGIKKYVGDPIGFKFAVIYDASVTLKEGVDYEVSWFFKESGSANKVPMDPDEVPNKEGEITASINGITKADGSGYKDCINVLADMELGENVTVSANDFEITASSNYVTISNNSPLTVYVDLVSDNAIGTSVTVLGDEVEPGKSVTLYAYYDAEGKRHAVTGGMSLYLVGDIEYVFYAKDAKIQESFTTPPASGGETPAAEDGYQKIKFAATVVKNTQTIKLSWKPAKSLKYKYYELQRLEGDGETFTTLPGWKGKGGVTLLAKTGYTYGKTAVERAVTPAVFRLRCYDAKKDLQADYITVAAPSLLYVEGGYDENTIEYCFSKLFEEDSLSYKLELAEKKAENGSTVVGRRGFRQTEDLATVCTSTDLWTINGFKVKKGLAVDAVREYFQGSDELKIKPGATYYSRVKSMYEYHGVTYTSAPSNIVARKAGPAKAYVMDITGVKYTKPSGKAAVKAATDAANIQKMDEYLNGLFASEDYDPSEINSDLFIHKANQSPDAKSGYVVFFADKISDNKLKGFELLRSDTKYGTYKKLKLYKIGADNNPVRYSGLYKWTPADPSVKALLDGAELDVYYMQYGSFPPEKTYYYAVRGVYKAGSAAGGFGDGYECTPELDTVQNIYAIDGTIDKINLYWSFDNCVKEYWVYKKQLAEGDDPNEFTKLENYKLLKKVKGKKSGTLKATPTKAADKELYDSTSGNLVGNYVKFTDKDNTKYVDRSKNRVIEGTNYQYVVVPKYNTKNADPDYNLDKKSDAAYGAATIANARIKNFAASNYGVGRIRVSWSKLKGATAYCVVRTEDDPNTVDWTNEEGFKTWIVDSQSDELAMRNAFKNNAFIDYTAVVGQKYYYMIVAGSKRSETLSLASYRAAKSLPLAVTSVKVSNGSSYKKGAKISWTPNTRDAGKGVTYRIDYREKHNGHSSYGGWEALTKNPVSGTSYPDNTALARGVVRQYRVVSVYNGIAGGIKEGKSYSKPTYIELSAGNTTLAVGESMNLKVTPKREGSPSVATDKRMSSPYSSNENVAKITGSKIEDDHVVYTIQAVGKGVATITVRTEEPNWVSNTSTSNLTKTIVITVR